MEPLHSLFRQSPHLSHSDPHVEQGVQQMEREIGELQKQIVELRYAMELLHNAPAHEKNGLALCFQRVHSVPSEYLETVEETERFFALTLQKVQKEFQRIQEEESRLLASFGPRGSLPEESMLHRKAPLEAAKERCENDLEAMIQSLIDILVQKPGCTSEKAPGMVQELLSLKNQLLVRRAETMTEVHSSILRIRESVSSVLLKLDINELEPLGQEFYERNKGIERHRMADLFSPVVNISILQKMPACIRREFLLSSLVLQLARAKDFHTSDRFIRELPEGKEKEEALANLAIGFADIKEFGKARALIDELLEGSSRSRAIWYVAKKMADAKQFLPSLGVAGLLFDATSKEALISDIIPKIVDDEQFELAFSLAHALFYDMYKSASLQNLVCGLANAKQFEQAKAKAQHIPDEHVKSKALLYLVERMTDEGRREDALDLVSSISSEKEKSQAMHYVVVAMVLAGAEHKSRAMAVAESIPLENERLAAIEFVLEPSTVPRRPKRSLEN